MPAKKKATKRKKGGLINENQRKQLEAMGYAPKRKRASKKGKR